MQWRSQDLSTRGGGGGQSEEAKRPSGGGCVVGIYFENSCIQIEFVCQLNVIIRCRLNCSAIDQSPTPHPPPPFFFLLLILFLWLRILVILVDRLLIIKCMNISSLETL